MGIHSKIKSELLKLESGKFQRLCDDWLHRIEYKNINSIGMMETTDRVKRGTPDSLIMLENGNYILAEYTTQQKRLAKKIKDDINKCLDEVKTGISIDKISEIIICYLGKLSTTEISELRNLCFDRGVMLTLHGLDSIALSIKNSYPVLSEIYLGLPLDTGQLLTIDDFIERYGKSDFTTSIDNELLFQDDLLNVAEKTLKTTNFLLVSGAAGVGKTLFSVNLAKKLKLANNELNIICLFDKGADLISDITACFSEPGDYLIFVDDANRLDNRLDYILYYLHEVDESRTFRIVATVRDYARSSVIERVNRHTKLHEIIIDPLPDGQIKELTDTLFGIKNEEFQEKIQKISGGNARLAVMASKIAVETNKIQSIQNATSLYEKYFSENDNVKQVIENKQLMIAACAISFFRTVDKLNEQKIDLIENSFGIQSENFWGLVDVLHKSEIVDLYENEVVKISDQILSTYLFYITVFDKRVVPFSVIVKNFYPSYKKTIVDSLNPVISSFDQEKIVTDIRREIKEIFYKSYKNKDIEASVEFLNTFWFSLPTDSLSFAKKVIEEMPVIKIDWEKEDFEESKDRLRKSSLIKLLINFRYFDEKKFKNSFELLLKYLEKNKSSLGFVIQALLNQYDFKHDDCRYAYFLQNCIVDILVERMDNGKSYLHSRLFLLVANAFLKVKYRDHQWADGDFIFISFRLSPDKYMLPLRKKLITNLAILAKNPSFKPFVLDCFRDYVNSVVYEGKEMVEADLLFFKDYFVGALDSNDVSHCIVMQDYCDHLESLELSFPGEWKEEFFNEILELSNLLLEDRHKWQMSDMGYEEYNKYRHQSLVEYFSDITCESFINVLEKCKILHQALPERDRDYSLKNGIEMTLCALAEAAPDIFPELVSKYIEYDDTFEINPHSVVNGLFEVLSDNDVYALLNSKECRRKKLWISAYFSLLPEASITENKAASLIEHIRNTPSNELQWQLDFLEKYQRIDSTIYCKVVKILIDKSRDDSNYATPLAHMFRAYSDIFGNWFEVFKSDDNLVFEAYLATYNLGGHWDYSGDILKLLINREFEFLYKLIDKIYEKEKRLDLYTNMPKLYFLWEREKYVDEIECYGKYLLKKNENSYRYCESIFNKLFIKEKGKVETQELTQKKQEFFKLTIKNNANDINYMCFIFKAAQHLTEEFRQKLVGLFININRNIEDFQTLDYEMTTQMWSGSRVPILEREKSFLEGLLPLFNTTEFLEHKSYIEEQIDKRSESIESEKKRDYMESRH